MCGIVAVLRSPSSRSQPRPGEIVSEVVAAGNAFGDLQIELTERLATSGAHLAVLDECLRGVPGLMALVSGPHLVAELQERLWALASQVSELEQALDSGSLGWGPGEVERINAALSTLKDRLWSVERDRLGTALQVKGLAGPDAGRADLEGYFSIQIALAALDRLEVRGRDSAGLHVLVWGSGIDPARPDIEALMASRDDPLFRSSTVRSGRGWMGFVYKAAAEIGSLGDNVSFLRKAVAQDGLLRLALSRSEGATVLGHTRWASVGTISEANAHPLDGLLDGSGAAKTPFVVGALNGDIDNYQDLVSASSLPIAAAITTDAKLIPTMIARRLEQGECLDEAFSRVVAEFEGSMAIAASSAVAPDRLCLAVRGSGQGLYVGVAENAFVVASEPYGVIEQASSYVRIDGDSTSGRLVYLDAGKAGLLDGVDRRGYDGRRLPVTSAELQEPEITTRDIDRRGFEHFLLKEITEAPDSFRKTLRGRVFERADQLVVALDPLALPASVINRLKDGSIRRIFVVGQGTAAVAGQAVAQSLRQLLGTSDLAVEARPATELSGFELEDDMSDTLVVAISQSGTTTDTNRTVDLARARGAATLAIVNRRQTELGEKVEGVIYTSDGRDVEMSVASTKAFYAQIAAGFLLSLALADEIGGPDSSQRSVLLSSLIDLPTAMEQVLGQRKQIAEIAARWAPRRRHWAVVGSGLNKVAAAEVRIKLSELCYKSVACDSLEDKKHIDLSAEPLIVVCASGLSVPNAEDAAKEVAIYRAHKAVPIVICTADQPQFLNDETIQVPEAHPSLAFILSAMAGHLFGYEAALAIDAGAVPLREIRAGVQELAAEGLAAGEILEALPARIEAPSRIFLDGLSDGAYDGVAQAGDSLKLALMLKCALGDLPIDTCDLEAGPGAFLDRLLEAVTRVIDDLTRSVDAVKHQAKTVTVGISRSEDALFGLPLVKEILRVGLRSDDVGYRALRTLAALDPAVEEVVGYTRYAITGDVAKGQGSISVIDRGGIAVDIPSRTESDPTLRGTKRAAVAKGEVEVTVGRSDGRPVLLVPERKGQTPAGLTLLHVRFRPSLQAEIARGVLKGYREARYQSLVAAVTETEREFDTEVLATLTMPELLVEPVLSLAERWRSPRPS
jgi:glutamine---fructose-6-phosphate transaminase (isomerizing)